MTRDRTPAQWSTEEELRTAPASRDRDRTERFTDEEARFLRHARFGTLPAPVPPEEWVEEQDESDSRYEPPELPFDPRQGGNAG